jgi:serine protease AprX
VLSLLTTAVTTRGGDQVPVAKLDLALRQRLLSPRGFARVIVRATDVDGVETLVSELGGRSGRRLPSIAAVVAEVPASRLGDLAGAAIVRSVSADRRVEGTLDRTAASIGARWVNEQLGVDGTGVGVAIIDSGVTRAHDDLGANRVVQFVDFVDLQARPHDGYGHGTHVAGIIAGSGYDSDGARRGIAPGAHLIVLRALDAHGDGYISSAIAAIDYAIEQRAVYNIRVINLSVAAGVYESYKSDPLTLAARRAVDAGIVVVTAAGNLGRTVKGQPQAGGITSPGNAPWVLTVGAASHNGTVERRDDTVAPFSSMGPTAIDHVAKPDLVAPGVGIESLSDPGSTLFVSKPDARLWGTVPTATQPYLSLSGTSMAAPVVSATIALMLQANAALTPAAVKSILRSSAEPHGNASAAAQGAGFLDARAAVEMSRRLVDQPDAAAALESDGYDEADLEMAATVCDAADAYCTNYLAAACTGSGCFDERVGALVGLSAAPEPTVIWSISPERPARKRRQRRHRMTTRTGADN